MITKLNDLSVADFIELSCNNTDVLLGDGSSATKEELKEARHNLMYEYKQIVNPAAMASLLLDKNDDMKVNMSIFMLSLCNALLNMDGEKEVLEIMQIYKPGYDKKGEELKKDVNNLLREKQFLKKRMDNITEKDAVVPTEKEIRDSFDREIAFVMTYFKMNLDIRITSASVYANIVHQAVEQAKRRAIGK